MSNESSEFSTAWSVREWHLHLSHQVAPVLASRSLHHFRLHRLHRLHRCRRLHRLYRLATLWNLCCNVSYNSLHHSPPLLALHNVPHVHNFVSMRTLHSVCPISYFRCPGMSHCWAASCFSVFLLRLPCTRIDCITPSSILFYQIFIYILKFKTAFNRKLILSITKYSRCLCILIVYLLRFSANNGNKMPTALCILDLFLVEIHIIISISLACCIINSIAFHFDLNDKNYYCSQYLPDFVFFLSTSQAFWNHEKGTPVCTFNYLLIYSLWDVICRTEAHWKEICSSHYKKWIHQQAWKGWVNTCSCSFKSNSFKST